MREDTKATRHSWPRRLFSLFLPVAVVSYFYRRPDSFNALGTLCPHHLLLGAFILFLKTLLKGALSYLIAVRLVEKPPNPRAWFQIHVHGRTMNFFTLKTGDLYRAHQTKTRFGLKLTHDAATLLFNAWLELIAMLAAALVATLLSQDRQATALLHPAWLAFALPTTLGLPTAAKPLAHHSSGGEGWRSHLQNLTGRAPHGFDPRQLSRDGAAFMAAVRMVG